MTEARLHVEKLTVKTVDVTIASDNTVNLASA
jgi:hypothetical protein